MDVIPDKLVDLLLQNFTSASKVGAIPGVVDMVTEFKQNLRTFASSDAELFFWESIRRGLFPEAMTEYVEVPDTEIHNQVVRMGQIIREFWTGLLDKVLSVNKSLMKETVKISVIRPILSIEWRTTIIPQSSMVFFRYINQMGYKTKFKFTPTVQGMVRMVSNETEQTIVEVAKRYVESSGVPIDQIKAADVISHVQASYPDLNITRGTPVWNLVSGYVQQLKPLNL
jgi:hypothetical protein